VAERSEAGVVGWVHVYLSDLLERDRQAEIGDWWSTKRSGGAAPADF